MTQTIGLNPEHLINWEWWCIPVCNRRVWGMKPDVQGLPWLCANHRTCIISYDALDNKDDITLRMDGPNIKARWQCWKELARFLLWDGSRRHPASPSLPWYSVLTVGSHQMTEFHGALGFTQAYHTLTVLHRLMEDREWAGGNRTWPPQGISFL